MRTVSSNWWLRVAWLCCALFAARAGGTESVSVVTNLLQIRQPDFWKLNTAQVVQLKLEGQVCWVSSTGQQLALADASGGSVLEMVGQSMPPVRVGELVRLSGFTTLTKRGGSIVLDNEILVVDNDGAHAMTEKSGAVFLKAGRKPIRVEWFNSWREVGLALEYEGPNRARGKVSDGELFRIQDETNWVNGVDYREYESGWDKLPWFSALQPLRSGTCSNFDLRVRTRKDRVGLEFNGFLKVPRDGLYKFYLSSDDGSRLFIGGPDLKVEVLGERELPAPRQLFVGQVLKEEEDGLWAVVQGKVTQAEPETDGLRLQLCVGLAQLEVKVSDTTASPTALLNSVVRAVGFCQCAYDTDGFKVPHRLLVSNLGRMEVVKASSAAVITGTAGITNGNPARLPLLTIAAEVHHLKPEEARLGYPVKMRGVVTSRNAFDQAFTLQDSTRGIFVRQAEPVQIGEYLEVEGVTAEGGFAPVLKDISRMAHLGWGRLPEPLRPAWEELMNGSLDNQRVEVEGIVAGTNETGVDLLTPGGLLKMELINGAPAERARCRENALVRIQGTLIAAWNPETHQVRPGYIGMNNFTVTVEKPPPKNLFDAPGKTPAELLLFDPQASVFQRVRVSGQVVHVGEEACFMMAGSNGLRFVADNTGGLQVGDLVEVAGHPELGGVSPLLRKAVARKTGHEALPEPRQLSSGQLLAAEYDSTLVRVTGVLAEARETPEGGVLEMLNGARGFVARMNKKGSLRSLPPESRLELTGVYSATGRNKASRQDITSFELLLDSPADIRILARPPWWTLKRLLVLSGALGCILAGAGLWITQLHRKVEQRTRELEGQIREREHIEQHRAMEQERARIARDLHDELGSGLTEIRMLATLAAKDPHQSHQQVQIASRSRQMVRALDEIVWAMNPKHDSLKSLGSYCCLYAERFLKSADISCRLKGTLELADQPLNPLHRHEFFLAFKEALTNIVCHSSATEARVGIHLVGPRLRLSLADNGQGLKTTKPTEEMDGLANMRARIEKIGGRFCLTSLPGRGTTLRFYLPLS